VLEPIGYAGVAVELDAETGAHLQPARDRDIDEREGAQQALTILESRLQRIEPADELRAVVLGAGFATVLGFE